MNKNPQNTQAYLNTNNTNTTNLINIMEEEKTIPEIARKQEFLELDRLLELSKKTSSNSMSESTPTDKEIWNIKKESIIALIKKKHEKDPDQNTINPENFNSLLDTWTQWRKKNAYWDMKCNDIWEKTQKRELVNEVLREKKLNLCNYTEFLAANKQTVLSEFKQKNTQLLVQNKPLGRAGDITINELITKGLDVFDTPLVQMLKDNVDVQVVVGFLSSMILYKTIVNLYVKSANNKNLSDVLKPVPSTRAKELALFMLLGAPFVAGCMWTGKTVIGGKVVLNILANNELEGSGSVRKTEIEGTSSISKSSFFLFLNKLPSWLKVILKYIALYFIGLFILKVFGYNSNIVPEIYSQFSVILEWFLKIYCILNLFVLIYFICKLYIIVMYAKNKEFIKPDSYPQWIKNDLIESKDIAINIYLKKPENQGLIYKHYLKLIFLYGSIVFFGFIVIILYTS